MNTETNLPPFERALRELDRGTLHDIVSKQLENGISGTGGFLDQLVVPAMDRLGELWEQGEVSLAQLYLAGRICEELVSVIPAEMASPRPDQPKVAIAVLGDYHRLGKRMVISALKSASIAVVDLGHGLTVDDCVKKALENETKILLVSVLMLPSALKVRDLRARLDKDIRIVVGGAPFRLDARLSDEVGADAMGRNSAEATRIVSHLIGAMR